MGQKPRTKRIILVNRDFQLRYVKMAVLVGLASTVLTVFLILTPLFYMNILRFPDFLPTPFLWAIALAAVCNFGCIAFLGVLITHRIAGPMFSLARQMHRIREGQWASRFSVRNGDELKYLVRNFNDLVDYLAASAAKERESLDRLRGIVEDWNPTTDEESTRKEEARALLEELEKAWNACLEGGKSASEQGKGSVA